MMGTKFSFYEMRALRDCIAQNDLHFALPWQSASYQWADLDEECLGRFWEPDRIDLPNWYRDQCLIVKNDLKIDDFDMLLPTIGHELVHLKQFSERPSWYLFAKCRLWARWTIEPPAFAEEKRIRIAMDNAGQNQENYG